MLSNNKLQLQLNLCIIVKNMYGLWYVVSDLFVAVISLVCECVCVHYILSESLPCTHCINLRAKVALGMMQ